MTQCAAVKTQEGSISEPPQNCLFELFINITCHGQLFIAASVPPTMRVLGRDPQEPEKVDYTFHYNTLIYLWRETATDIFASYTTRSHSFHVLVNISEQT